MGRSAVIIALAVLGAACTDSGLDPSPPGTASLAASRVTSPKIAVCHVDEWGLFHPLEIAPPAVTAHLEHGDNPLLGAWVGSWWVGDRQVVSMQVQFRDDCSGFSPDSPFATVSYGDDPVLCQGYWTYTGGIAAGWAGVETITSGPCVTVPFELVYDAASGWLRMNMVDPRYLNQHGELFRAP